MNANAPKLKIVYRPTSSLVPYAKNSNVHDDAQVRDIANSIATYGFTNPVLIDEHGGIIAGHGRVMAALLLGLDEVPCIVLAHLTEEQRRAYVIADNQLSKRSTWDMDVLLAELAALSDANYDLTLTGFTYDELDSLLRGEGLLPDQPAPATPGGPGYAGVSQPFPEKYQNSGDQPLLRNYGVPPFSIFDTRQGYWQRRKKEWLALLGDTSATKEGTLSGGYIMQFINNGSSGFDPVLAEIMMRWYCLPGGSILDPFGGEQTKGYVAGYLGYQYEAVEMRQEQVDVNRAACAGMEGVRYVVGDSNGISKLIKRRGFDLVFTSPPYYDLEVYSTEDMSALGTYDEFMAQYEAIFRQCVEMLADNRFLIVKVGEIRDRNTGGYRNFIGHNVDLFQRLGLTYYNEIVMVTPIGTAAIRAGKTFRTRKVVRTHQHVLIFYKGALDQITKVFPAVEFDADMFAGVGDDLPDGADQTNPADYD